MLEEQLRYNHLFRNSLGFVRLLTFLFLFPFLLLPSSSKATNLFLSDIPIIVLDKKTKEPLIGATIQSESGTVQQITDVDGKAVLSNVGYREIILISYIGYTTLELPIYEIRRNKGVILMEEGVELVTAVVYGRTETPSEEMIYKAERITTKEIRFSNAQTSAELLEKSGGLFIQKSQMGGGSPIIRGFEANRVLLVVDGVRMNNAIYRNGHLQNAITIDPAILDRAEVIYGPGSLNYGSDAIGGVVHYRTKDPKLATEGEDVYLKTNASLRYSYANSEKAFHVDFNQGKKRWGTLTSLSMVDYNSLISGSKRPEVYPNFGVQSVYPVNVINIFDKGPVSPNVQEGTDYGQIDILQKIKFQPSEKLSFVANLQWSSSTNVPRFDNLVDTVSSNTDLKWAEWFYGPQQRILGSIKTKILEQKLFNKGIIIASFQKVDEDRNQRKWRKNWRSVSQVDVFVYSLTADFDKYLDEDERTTISYGLDISRNDVVADAFEINVRNQDIVIEGDDIITRYPSQGSSMSAYGAYSNFKWKSKNKVLAAEAGLRYSYVKLAGFFGGNDPITWPQNYIDGIYLKNNALTFGTGLTANTKNKWQFRALVASAFRSPNIDDFAQIREKNGFITVPNPTLKPEESFTFEGTIGKEFGEIKKDELTKKKSGKSLNISGTIFKTHLKNALVRKNFSLPDGSFTLSRDEEILEIQANVNAATANIYGFSGNLSFKIGDKIELASNINYTKGTSRFQDNIEGIAIDTIVPFAHIPPLYGRTSLTFNVGKWKLSPVVRYNGRKRPTDYAVASARIVDGNIVLRRDGTSDNIDYTPYGFVDSNGDVCSPSGSEPKNDCERGYAGSLAWTTYNFYGEYSINEQFSLNFSFENILDLHYRPFSSGVSSAGRGFSLGIRGSF